MEKALIELVAIWKTYMNKPAKRSNAQNRALHKYESELADFMRESGIDMRQIVKEGIPIPATPANIHDLFNRISIYMFDGKTSSELNAEEFREVTDYLLNVVSERIGSPIDFPSYESQSISELLSNN